MFIKLGEGAIGFIGENLGRAKGFIFIYFSSSSRTCLFVFLRWGFNRYKEWIFNSMERITSRKWSFKKRGKGARIIFSFSKGVFFG